jgi:hypothetical protein
MQMQRYIQLKGLMTACLLVVAQVARAQVDCEIENDLVQIILNPGFEIEAIESSYNLESVDSIPPSAFLLQLTPGQDRELILALLEVDPRITVAEHAFRGETPEGRGQMMVAAVGGTISEYQDQEVLKRLRVGEAHQHTTGDGIIIAVIDTGVRADHVALAGAILPNGIDYVDDDGDPGDDSNQLDDDLDGFVDDGAGHGTIIAGIVRLVAPGASILPIRVLDDEGRGLSFDVAKGLRYAADQGAQVVNLSLAMSCESRVMAAEIARAESLGISMVAAAGNDNSEEPALYPARDPRTLSIAALDSVDVKSPFSNYHATVSLSAPGQGILGPFHDGSYALGAGTSFAAPFVTGAIALIRATNPGLTKVQVDSLARLAAIDVYDIPDNQPYVGKLGTGRLDAFLAWEQTPVAADASSWPSHEPGGRGDLRMWATPNPSRVTEPTVFQFDLPTPGDRVDGQLAITDCTGRLLKIIPVGSIGSAIWDGRTQLGNIAPAGIYYATLDATFERTLDSRRDRSSAKQTASALLKIIRLR